METNRNSKADRFHRTAVSVREARESLLNLVRIIDIVEVDLLDSIGRRLAEDIRTSAPIPH
jgi:molybdopterin biosynthesis enzyme